MSSFTVTPSLFSISRSRTVVIQGSGTAWTTGTTFSLSGGIATVTGVTVNAGTQKVTATINPGPNAATLTLSNSTDGNTVTITVAASQTFSGTNLTSYTAQPLYVFDATNEIPADAVGHVMVITAGTGFTPGAYTINQVQVATTLSGGQGTHNIAQLMEVGSTTVGAASGAASGGSYSWFMGQGGGGFGGTNLISWFKGAGVYCYDPDAPLSSSLNGTTIAISAGGTGATPGNYTGIAFNTNFATGDSGTQQLIKFGSAPGAQGWYGYPWLQSGGTVIPTPVVNNTYTGAIKVLLVGDSITQRQTTTTASLTTQYPHAASVAVSNQGQSGSQTTDWLIAASSNYLNNAITAGNAQGSTVCFLMLGTNDAIHSSMAQATHTANIQAICNSLFAGISTLVAVVLMEQPAVGSAISGFAGFNTLLQSYFASYNTVTGAVQGVSSAVTATITNFAYFNTNPSSLQDGIHPTVAGTAEVYYTWLTSAANSIVNGAAPAAPTVSSVSVRSDGLALVVSCTTGASPMQGTNTTGWTPLANGITSNAVTSVTWAGTVGTLLLTNPVLQTDTYTLAYNAAVGNVTDSKSGTPLALATFAAISVTNGSVVGTITSPPTVTSVAFVESAGTLTVTYGIVLPTHGTGVIAHIGGVLQTLGGTPTAPILVIPYDDTQQPPQVVFSATNAITPGGGPSVIAPIYAVSGGGGGGGTSGNSCGSFGFGL